MVAFNGAQDDHRKNYGRRQRQMSPAGPSFCARARRLVADATEMVMSMKALRRAVLGNQPDADDGVVLGGDPGSI